VNYSASQPFKTFWAALGPPPRRSPSAAARRFFEQHYRIFSVQAPTSQLVRELNAYRPGLLSGFTTALVALAYEAGAGRLRIRRGLCSRRRRRWPPRTARLSLRPSAHTVLVTDLANRIQPIIRYVLGDAITVASGPCPCGSPLMGIRPRGRSGEVLALPARAGDQPITVLPLALSTVVEETPGVGIAQVVHVPPDRLRIRFTTVGRPRDEVDAAIRHRLAAWLHRQGAATVQIDCDDALPTRDPRSGKFRAVSLADGRSGRSDRLALRSGHRTCRRGRGRRTGGDAEPGAGLKPATLASRDLTCRCWATPTRAGDARPVRRGRARTDDRRAGHVRSAV
jgi:hypothetical protein